MQEQAPSRLVAVGGAGNEKWPLFCVCIASAFLIFCNCASAKKDREGVVIDFPRRRLSVSVSVSWPVLASCSVLY